MNLVEFLHQNHSLQFLVPFDNGIAGDSNYQYGCNTWENSDIRLWLNSKKLPGNKEETNIPGWWDTSKKTVAAVRTISTHAPHVVSEGGVSRSGPPVNR